MKPARIVNRGDGPRIEGTRITVYTVLEYVRTGETRDSIAAALNLSSREVEAAMDYIRENQAAVNAGYELILARIRKGNSPEIEAKLQVSREKLRAMRARMESTRQ
jgi:uncharacterized protein (DUF433 family)